MGQKLLVQVKTNECAEDEAFHYKLPMHISKEDILFAIDTLYPENVVSIYFEVIEEEED